MYFTSVFLVSWMCFYVFADKSRVREFFGVMIWSSFLGLLTDLIMVHHKMWSYNGLPHSLYTVPLLLDFSIYPVVTYLFVQTMPKGIWPVVLRALLWSSAATLFEYVTLKVGVMRHHDWWSMWLSFISDNVIFYSIAAIYHYYRPAYAKPEPQEASQG